MVRSRRGAAATPGGRVVLITGASGGFGRLIAAALAGGGWRVFATMRDPDARGRLDEEVLARGADPSSVRVPALDVLSPESINAAVSQVLEESAGRLDAVVANAGILVAGAFEDTPADAMRAVMETNYFGVIETVRATLPALRAARGRIVIMSSDSGLCGTPALSGYTASKYALEGWGESLAYEVRPLGVAVSMIEPGPFRTDIFAKRGVHRGPSDGPYAALADVAEATLRTAGLQAPNPDAVVRAVGKALSARNPRLRYPVGREAWLIAAARRFLPDRIFGFVLLRATGMRWSRRANQGGSEISIFR
jgi:NAD(P)-dependent dehydrogenase (short-subunit alcohol dehydrogenase family)